MNRSAWRDQVVEEVLEPELPIIDAHHHIWPLGPPEPYGAYTAEDALRDKVTSGHNIQSTVYVDSHASYFETGPEHLRFVGETAYAESVAEEALRQGGKAAGFCAAIVTHADLLMGAGVGEVLDAHMQASSRFRGIRHMTAYEAIFPPFMGVIGPG